MSKSSIQSYFPLPKLICKIVFVINKSLFPRIEEQSMNKIISDPSSGFTHRQLSYRLPHQRTPELHLRQEHDLGWEGQDRDLEDSEPHGK